ncbi:MAG: hypothetical protein COW24_02210 [Candidatus Kerfeldbacteria bacterium CG15_BIG_FIL_POST_REV_8_21_14_020_45_12]|uniref:SHSP domain-containing protein n=1 Tax=Candidatus Kerfeldbacteria bacterium CG15_BIG_FIL_POST_REV_8_21_14_020_45_12 TaxID=2014247 RepID=A0A2M7H4A0_9BACT|nr:MAG: hypothetical protein COW24_02210 [Candidatus Kerfeldbacteria bacterium CG15_BIG_FIL_POST_REV_8_21_14_020_45_12]PJA94055.1 MAG: hypothetical protein CO132_00285 [Candidatus Kerfeldbacteria bacterium CG_4_9_14_3_um_filter_45_8]
MSDSDSFAKKIKELSGPEVQFTDDFFEQSFVEVASLRSLKQGAAEGSKRTITDDYNPQDIDDEWLEQPDDESYDGQLAVDVYQTADAIIITSTVAGVRGEDLDVQMNGDMVTIKGRRRDPGKKIPADDYFLQECYWGGFSRSVILPVDIQHEKIEATLENGILTISLPKSARSRNGKIDVLEVS